MKRILVGILLIGTFGCGSNQNPMMSKPREVREGRPPEQKIEIPAAVRSDAVLLDVPAVMNDFIETKETRVRIGARVLKEGYLPPRIEIQNPESFPGAILDGTTSEFVWTPPKGIVYAGVSRAMTLTMIAIAEPIKPEDGVLINMVEIPVTIQRKLVTPQIVSIERTNTNPIREGSPYQLVVKVSDLDAGNNLSERPILQILPPSGTFVKSMAGNASISYVTYSSADKVWVFRISIDLSNIEFTRTISQGGFDMVVVNRFNQVSPVANFRADIYSKISDIYTSWDRELVLTPGESVRIPVVFYDGKAEAKIDVSMNLPAGMAGATWQCGIPQYGWTKCEFSWQPPIVTPSNSRFFEIEAVAVGSNMNTSDTESIRRTFRLKIKVLDSAPTGGQK